MATSQNVRFLGHLASQDSDHPPGSSIVLLLASGLEMWGWWVSAVENWRDCGWSFICVRDSGRIEVALAKAVLGDEWYLQVYPAYVPGIAGRLMGRPVSASADEILRLAEAIHAVLADYSEFSNFRWCWDADPDSGAWTAEPVEVE